MKKLIFILSVSLIASCVPANTKEAQNIRNDSAAERLTYRIDKRTNLCFAMMDDLTYSITNVPCTPEVMRIVDGVK